MLNKQIKKLNKLDEKLSSIKYMQALLEWDGETIASKGGVNERSLVAGEASEIFFNSFINDEVKSLLDYLNEHKNELNEITKRKAELYTKEYEKIAKIPVEEYSEYAKLCSKSYAAWEVAKENNDFSSFAPYLEKIIKTLKKFMGYRGNEGHPYNALLEDYEPGVTMEVLDEFFDKLKESIVPLVKNLQNKPKTDLSVFNQKFDLDKQDKVSKHLMDILTFDQKRGYMTTSAHPFTLNLSRNDVRITTHYYENDLLSSIFSTIHETGHALYEQHINEEFGLSNITTGVSMGIHESQSRLYENNLTRNSKFWENNFPKLKEIFKEELDGVDLELWNKAINNAKPSLIRTEADELTYPLHILIRYELEKEIFSNDIDINELPKLWADKYEEYLGIRPENFSEGILQDVHWADGLFGYFPSYALGSAYAAQFENAMRKDIDLDTVLANNDMQVVADWLTDHIHKYGSLKTPVEIMKLATGEKFDAKYFIEYLERKFA